MATNRFIGQAPLVAQVNTVTPAVVAALNQFTLTCNSKTITVTSVAATVAEICTLMAAAVTASLIPEFQEVSAGDGVTALTLTSRVPGQPFTITSSAAGGTATFVTTLTTVNSGPNDLNVASNWSLGAVPVITDDVVLEFSNVNLLWNLDQANVVYNSLSIRASYTGRIGLPAYNPAGYNEYRARFWKQKTTTISVGDSPSTGAGSGRVLLDNTSFQTALTVFKTAAAVDTGFEAVQWKGTHASNTLIVYGGSVGVAVDAGGLATVATITAGTDPNLSIRCGSGSTLTTINQDGGNVAVNSAVTTWTMLGGNGTAWGTGAVTTLTVDVGKMAYNTSGTLGTPAIGSKGVLDFSGDLRTKTVTNLLNMDAGATLYDPYAVVTYSAGIKPVRCRVQDVFVNVGYGRTITPS